MIRVLLTIRQGKIGGGESHVLDLINHMDRGKFTPIVLSFTEGPMVETLKSWGVKTHIIYTTKAFDFFIWRKVLQFIKEEQIDLIHAHGTRANSNVFWAAKWLNIPLIYTVHGWSFHQDQSSVIFRLRQLGEKFLAKKSNLTICVSQSNHNDGEKLKLRNTKVINYGIDLNKFNVNSKYESLKAELGVPFDYTLVGYMVRITIQKDPHTFIKAISEIVKKTSSIRFLIIGDGDLKKSTISLAKKLNVESYIIFQDFRQDIPKVLAGIDIYCLPSLWEGLPIGLLEAMAMQKAIVATPVDGTKEAVKDGFSGLLVPHQSPNELAKAILKLHFDKKLLAKLGLTAHETILDRFEVKQMVHEVEKVYLNISQNKNENRQPTEPRRKRIGIEAQRLFREKKHGLEVVALEIIRHLQKIDKENDYVIFVRKDNDNKCIEETSNFKIREIEASSFPEWEQFKLPKAVKEEKIDLLHCTANTTPLFTSVPIILTLHDIIFTEATEFRGNQYQNFGNLYRRALLPLISKKVKKIITVSKSERDRIIKHLRTDPSKVKVIYNAVDESFKSLKESELESVRIKYNLPSKFILFFGNSAQKKNSLGTIRGYIEYAKNQSHPVPLVVAGAFENQVREALDGLHLSKELRCKILTVGYIPFGEQPSIYNLAHLFLYTSKRESFGMPILESMACGTPVVTSNTSSMPEIADGAAHLVDPNDPLSIGQGITTILNDSNKYDLLTRLGFKRARAFDWEHSAKQLLQEYLEVINL